VISYAQARIQARHGARPDARAWAMIHASVTLGSLLENARRSSLESWVAGLDPGAPRAEAEKLLRERLRSRIAEAARWMPEAWRPAVLRTASLIDLPERQRELRGKADEERAAAVRREWLAGWRDLWPDCAAEEREALEELVRVVEAHLERFARSPPDDAEPLRLALRLRVEALFRRHALGPAAAFEHLLLAALEAERLRAELMERVQ
jgi:hypothetical protein